MLRNILVVPFVFHMVPVWITPLH